MNASRKRGALTRALICLAALFTLAGPALAQAPTESAWKSVGAAWVEICSTPCRVTNVSSFAARFAVGSAVPVSDDSAAIVLTSQDAVRDFGVAGLKVYGRALANATRVVVEPVGGAPGAGDVGFATPKPSAAIAAQRTTGIGTTGVLVSAADAVNRRTVTNTSAIACELMGSAAAYGTGYPLPAGESFTFDAAGRTTAALYVACASAGGTAAVLSY